MSRWGGGSGKIIHQITTLAVIHRVRPAFDGCWDIWVLESMIFISEETYSLVVDAWCVKEGEANGNEVEKVPGLWRVTGLQQLLRCGLGVDYPGHSITKRGRRVKVWMCGGGGKAGLEGVSVPLIGMSYLWPSSPGVFWKWIVFRENPSSLCSLWDYDPQEAGCSLAGQPFLRPAYDRVV